MTQTLDLHQPQAVTYAIPLWLRDEQIRVNIGKVKQRIQEGPLRNEPIAVVCYGPSLNDTWEQIGTKYVMTCSGAHKFLIDRGIFPRWHVEVDPRKHKIELLGAPNDYTTYLIASTCHPDYVDYLLERGANVKLWHVFDTAEEGIRTLPRGEWALTGGCSVGLRALALARFLGFRDLHVFGMDGSSGKTGKHAAAHPNQAKQEFVTVYEGVEYKTTPGFLEAARTTFYELDQLKDVTATFYGEGLVQHMAKSYKRKPPPVETDLAFIKPLTISPEYKALNQQLHEQNLAYGVGGGKHAKTVVGLVEKSQGAIRSVLDYGCGKGYLAKELPWPIWEYDPCIAGKDETPKAADLVVCTDVLEHIEPDKLDVVLGDLRKVVKQLGYFTIHTGPAKKSLPDGRNTHLIQQPREWWVQALGQFFTVGKVYEVGPQLRVLVTPHKDAAKANQVRPILSLSNLTMRHDPYVIGVATDVFDEKHYKHLTEAWPDISLFKSFPGGDKKFSLSERNNPENYHKFIVSTPVWAKFHSYIKAPAFIDKIRKNLKLHDIDVDLTGATARFEFSALPAEGGHLRPHTDLPSKLVTLVLSMRAESDVWQDDWGGGTDVLIPHAEGWQDYAHPVTDFTKAATYAYRPNQCVLFIKSPTSWHSVGPFQGQGEHYRKTCTVNIERA